MKRQNKVSEQGSYLRYLFEISPFIIGLSCIYSTLFLAVLIALVLFFTIYFNKKACLYLNKSTVFGLLILCGGILSFVGGIDRGTSFEGILILCSAMVYILLLMQLPSDIRDSAFKTMPVSGTVLVLFCAAAYTIPAARNFLFKSSRLNGMFQYANTMALFLLICLVLYIYGAEENGKRKTDKNIISIIKNIFIPSVLFLGILWTGSRITFLITVISLIILILKNKEKKIYIFPLAVIIILAVVITFITKNTESFGRFLTPGRNSTLIGRILYWEDALPLILKHPLGLGYLGYSQIELARQHGYYYVEYVHNEILQCFLDYGWIGGISFILLIIHNIRNSKASQRFILVIMTIHMLFDFDLQFFPILWIYVTFMNWNDGHEICVVSESGTWKLSRYISGILLLIFSSCALWIGIPDLLDFAGHPDYAEMIYPFNYKYAEKHMYSLATYDESSKEADKILSLNPYHYMSYLLKANEARDNQDMDSMIRYGKKAVSNAPYQNELLNDYGNKLLLAIDTAEKSDDNSSLKRYERDLSEIDEFIKEVKDSTNPLAYKIKDKPNFKLNKKIRNAIDELD